MMLSKEGKVDSRKALDAGLVATESIETESERHVLSSRSGNDTHTDDADINSVNDKQPMAEVQLSAEHNILANEQQHSEQSESVYDTYLLENVDRNTTPESTDMSHRGGEIDQNADAKNVKFYTVAQLQKDFSRMETHCVHMELKYQNQALKDGQHGQSLNETINIELEHSMAKLLAENEMLHKENEHLKQTYKDLYDSIKKTRVQTNNLNDSLAAQVNSKTIENVDLKTQIEEKVFANVALKNELRKLKGNSVDTMFSKPSILGKPVLQPPRNQSVVRQPNAFKSKRPNFLKPRFPSQVDVNNVLSKLVTPHYLPKVREESAFTRSLFAEESDISEIKKTKVSGFTYDEQGQWLLITSDQHPCFMIMVSVDNTSGPAPQRKEECTLQCALSSKEEKSSCILQCSESTQERIAGYMGEAKTLTSDTDITNLTTQVTYVIWNLFYPRSLNAKTFITLEKKVKQPEESLDRERSDYNLFERIHPTGFEGYLKMVVEGSDSRLLTRS
ncbi:hypothetical protein Tco_0698127 [Tanacetum coccineum]